MTKRQFRLLLVAYCVATVVAIFWYSHHTTPTTLGDIPELKRRFGCEKWTDLDFVTFQLWVTGTITVAHLVGLIFAFLLWREGLYIFLIAIIGRSIYQNYYQHLRMDLYSWVMLLFELSIIAFGLLGPAKKLFQRRQERQI